MVSAHRCFNGFGGLACKITDSPELETEGKDENTVGKVQEKAGDIKKVFGK